MKLLTTLGITQLVWLIAFADEKVVIEPPSIESLNAEIKEEIETNNMLMLEQIKNIMDQRLKEIDDLTIQVENNQNIKQTKAEIQCGLVLKN